MKTTYSRTAASKSSSATPKSSASKSQFGIAAARYMGMLAILAAMLTASASARPIQLSIRLADPFHGCSPALGLCVSSFDNAPGTPSTRAIMDVKRDIAKGPLGANCSIRFVGQTPDGNEFPIADDIVLDRATSLALGYQQVTIKKGTYTVDRSTNPNGDVDVDVEVSGLYINIKFGRRLFGCTNFGICSITVGADAAALPGSAELNGNMLGIDLLAGVNDSATSIIIDEDIVLDNATSLELGAKRVTMKAGEYAIDRTSNPNGHVDVPVERFGIIVNIDYGARSQGCTGFGICSIEIILNMHAPRPSVVSVDGDMMTIDFLTPRADGSNTFKLDEDVVIEGPVAIEFTYQKIVMKAGTYDIDYSGNPNGTVNVPINRFGITVHVEVGRKSRDCRGFGICDIWIDFDLRANASGTLNGNTLSLDFLSDLKSDDGSDVLVIDEDIVLDSATARELGAGHVTVLKGAYTVDRTTNPNGRVNVQVERAGVTIYIEVGRRSKGCTGFGICSITIDLDLRTLSSTPAVITLDGKNAVIDFMKPVKGTSNEFVLEEDVVLDGKIARALGVRSGMLPAGSYELDYSSNPNGRVVIPVTTGGVSLTIYIGRSWGNCRGFGICNITLDYAMTDRSVKGSASISGSTMSLDLLGEAPEKGDELVIDEDITLSGATALALGYRDVTLKRGTYPVSYDENENGSVDIDVTTVGIIIKIDIGRPIERCYGFGICSITIDASAAMNRPAPAVVVAGSNSISAYFTEAPAEQGDTMYIDEDIELSGDVARAFGKDQLTIKKGAYVVDRSENAYGTVIMTTSDDGTASVDNDANTTAPIALSVHPNPASSAATVGFFVDGMQTVTLSLLDARGQVVKVLIDGERMAGGRHERTIELTDLPAGAYFQRLSIGSTNAITPLQVVR